MYSRVQIPSPVEHKYLIKTQPIFGSNALPIEIAEEWRKLSERRDKSEIIEIFYGQIKCTMKCQNPSCGHEQKTYELVFPLTLPIPTKSDVSLKDCLKLYTKEKLSTDPWYCDECNEVVDLSRKVEMWKMPQVLMVYLKRFCL
uniref:USP domain-containing protein n=1 Tax=Amphimedon queenslandica TaxID=400682 RepID=A0A1X7T4T3_AMPQE